MKGDAAETQKALTRSAGFLRNELGRRIKLFKMPELHFEYDHSIERGMSLDKLIDQAMQETGPADEEDGSGE
jgi:ribosome-binding factor A